MPKKKLSYLGLKLYKSQSWASGAAPQLFNLSCQKQVKCWKMQLFPTLFTCLRVVGTTLSSCGLILFPYTCEKDEKWRRRPKHPPTCLPLLLLYDFLAHCVHDQFGHMLNVPLRCWYFLMMQYIFNLYSETAELLLGSGVELLASYAFLKCQGNSFQERCTWQTHFPP